MKSTMNNQNMMNGDFINNGKEFFLKNPMTIRPWKNRLFNKSCYITVDQFGRGMSQYQDGIGNWSLLTELLHNDFKVV